MNHLAAYLGKENYSYVCLVRTRVRKWLQPPARECPHNLYYYFIDSNLFHRFKETRFTQHAPPTDNQTVPNSSADSSSDTLMSDGKMGNFPFAQLIQLF